LLARIPSSIGICMQDPNIQSQGGIARAKTLSAEERIAIATKAAKTRWADRPIQATHKGSLKEVFGIDVECYVLDDPQKTAVISQRGMGTALGFSAGGNRFLRFMGTNSMASLVGAEITGKITQPIKFQWGTGGAELPPTVVHGFDATLLIDICRIIEAAAREGKLSQDRHGRVIAQAHIINGACAKAGIKNLVYALAGYNPSAAEVIAAFKLYVQEEAKKYEKEFPPELYMAWHKLYEIPVLKNGRSWHFKHLTVDHIYYPLARSNGKILELTRALKSKSGDRRKKLFQFLSEVGARALRIQLGRVLEMSESSATKEEYEMKIRSRFNPQGEFEFSTMPPSPTDT
jgi:hypothetical protein